MTKCLHEKSSGVLRKDAVTKYAFLEHCINCAEVERQIMKYVLVLHSHTLNRSSIGFVFSDGSFCIK